MTRKKPPAHSLERRQAGWHVLTLRLRAPARAVLSIANGRGTGPHVYLTREGVELGAHHSDHRDRRVDVAIPITHDLLPPSTTKPRRIGRLMSALVYLDDDDPWPLLLTWGPGTMIIPTMISACPMFGTVDLRVSGRERRVRSR